ncbi:MAG: hypothetical protein ACE14S_12820 [Candidatus Bathyarchaeia archaeon]
MSQNSKPWHLCSYIPEIRFRDYNVSVKAWQNCKVSPRVAILNYFDLKNSGLLRKPEKVRKSLDGSDALILSCVGKDIDLDKLKVEDYFATAKSIGVKAIITPDDFIYGLDNHYPAYQAHHFRRAVERSEALIRLADTQLDVIGLVISANEYQMSLFVERFIEKGIRDFACACGDNMNRVKRVEGLKDIHAFMKCCANDWKLLLGVDSRMILTRMPLPNAYSSSEWSYYACHNMIYRDGKKRKVMSCDPKGWRLGLHNLYKNYEMMQR